MFVLKPPENHLIHVFVDKHQQATLKVSCLYLLAFYQANELPVGYKYV